MDILDLQNLFYCIATLFCLFPIIQFGVEILLYYKDKSLGNIYNSREIIMSAWLLLPFMIAYGFTIFIVKSFKELKSPVFILDNDYWIIFGFLIGLTVMITIFVITAKVKKGKGRVNTTLKTAIIGQKVEQNISTDNREILESDHVAKLMDNSNTNNNTSTRTFADLNNVDDSNQDNLERQASNTLSYTNNIKSKYLSQKTSKNLIKPILLKSSPVVPDNYTDEVISEIFGNLKKVYSAYCNFDDLKNLLLNVQIENKILFKDKYNTSLKFTRPEYLDILNYILDGNIFSHPNRKKVKEWIIDSFDNDNIGGKDISDVDLSRYK